MTPTPLSYRAVAKLPGIPGLLAAMSLSRLAEAMFALAIVLFVLQRFHAPSLAGWAAFLAMAPGLLASPVAGAVLDRTGAARAIAIDMAVSAALLLAMAAAAGSLGTLFALVGLYSLTKPLSGAGVRALLPQLVPRDAADRANALDRANWAVIEAAGPALCGILFALAGGVATMIAIAALSALAGASLIGQWRRPSAAVATGSSGRLWREALAGIGLVVLDPSLRGLALAYSLYQLAWGILVPAVPVAVAHALGAGGGADMAVGGLWAMAGAAAGLGALAAGLVRSDGRERRLLGVGMVLTAAGLGLPVAGFGLAGLALALPLIGLFAGPIDVGLLSLRQRRTDPARLGRVLAVSMSLNQAGLPLGAALGGLIVARSLPAAFAAAAVAAGLGAAAVLLIPSDHNRNGINAGVTRR